MPVSAIYNGLSDIIPLNFQRGLLSAGYLRVSARGGFSHSDGWNNLKRQAGVHKFRSQIIYVGWH
jgi:hypothetical protein